MFCITRYICIYKVRIYIYYSHIVNFIDFTDKKNMQLVFSSSVGFKQFANLCYCL